MTPDPWALPAHFYSIIVKRQAIIRSFRGGIEEFERVYSPGKNGALFRIACMSGQETDYVLDKLNDAGVIPGKDVGVIDMTQGPLLECPGIVFQCVEDDVWPKWTVNVEVRTAESMTERVPAAAVEAKHTICVRYVDSALAVLGHWEDSASVHAEHAIQVDSALLAQIKAGEMVRATGQGWLVEGEGMVCDTWLFNERRPGSVAICLDRENGEEPEWFEAIEAWIDGVPQARIMGYFD